MPAFCTAMASEAKARSAISSSLLHRLERVGLAVVLREAGLLE